MDFSVKKKYLKVRISKRVDIQNVTILFHFPTEKWLQGVVQSCNENGAVIKITKFNLLGKQ